MWRLLLAVMGFALLAAAVVIGLRALWPVPAQLATVGGADARVMALAMQAESSGEGDTGEAAPGPPAAIEVYPTAAAVAPPAALMTEELADAPAEALAEPPGPVEAAESAVALPPEPATEQRLIELEWPGEFRLGGSGVLRLTFKPLEDGTIAPVAEFEGSELSATPILLTDRYATHDARVAAVLAAPTFTVAAATPEQQMMGRGQAVEWLWTLVPQEAGEQVIALSVTVNWQPRGGGAVDSVTVWSDALAVQVGQIFGLTVPQAGLAGTVAAVLGVVLEIPFLDNILGFLWGRRPRRRGRRERR